MGEQLFEIARHNLAVHGYWAVAIALLLENSGVPFPGETVLLLASFLAYSEHHLQLPYIILTAVVASTLGDNIGYLIGHHGGRPLLERYRHLFRIPVRHIDRGERLFASYGAVTVFFARFVFGMRVLAGPLAGVLKMPWQKFVMFNFLGAAVWVTVVASAGYLFGQYWNQLIHVVQQFNLFVAAFVLVGILVWWWRRRLLDRADERE